ncbi:unnamed protein product, partial [Chrysoparadoxa australica]
MALRQTLSHSLNDSQFVLDAVKLPGGKVERVDGRGRDELRSIRVGFGRGTAGAEARAEVQLGKTRVLAVVTAEVVAPYRDRPAEGFLYFNVELSPMAAAVFGKERNPPQAQEMAKFIESEIRDSQALDTEALCIISGSKVWCIRCDIHALDQGGNLLDAASLAAIAALQHFRIPEVSVSGDSVIVHHPDDRQASPLSLHHRPISITFGLFGGVQESEQHFVVDPSLEEEQVMTGRVTYSLNAHKELCGVHKNGGTPLSLDTMLQCSKIAADAVEKLHRQLDEALAKADTKAKEAQKKRLRHSFQEFSLQEQSSPYRAETGAVEVTPELGGTELKHLDYADLHVTGKVSENMEPKKGKVLMAGSALFLAMTRAASLAADAVATEDVPMHNAAVGDGQVEEAALEELQQAAGK